VYNLVTHFKLRIGALGNGPKGIRRQYMESLFKLFLSVLVIFFCLGSLRWIWRSQIDIKETGKRLLKTPQESMGWVVTRDPQKIYQDVKVVGNICDEVKNLDNQIVFVEICDTEQLDTNIPFEYKRRRLKIVRIDKRIGLKSVVTSEGAISRKAVITNVVCEKIE